MSEERTRLTSTKRSVAAYCVDCDATWGEPGAQGSAAHHHDLTGHTTVARIEMTVTYGTPPAEPKAPRRLPGAPRQRERVKPWRSS